MLQSILKILFYKLGVWSLKDMSVYQAERTRFSRNLGNLNGFIMYYRLKVRISKPLLPTFCQLFVLQGSQFVSTLDLLSTPFYKNTLLSPVPE